MTDERPRVLVVEDDDATRTFLADNLTADGFCLGVASSVTSGWRRLEALRPGVAVVDVGLPDGSGLDLVRRVREADALGTGVDPRTPILVLSGQATEVDRVRGLQRGADDYVAKPFGYAELLLRVRRLALRGDAGKTQTRVQIGPLLLDVLARSVTVDGRPVDLSAKEFALLRALAADPHRVWTKQELLRDVWEYAALGQTRTLDSHACRLRRKLGASGRRFVVNVWGVGYRLLDADTAPYAAPAAVAA